MSKVSTNPPTNYSQIHLYFLGLSSIFTENSDYHILCRNMVWYRQWWQNNTLLLTACKRFIIHVTDSKKMGHLVFSEMCSLLYSSILFCSYYTCMHHLWCPGILAFETLSLDLRYLFVCICMEIGDVRCLKSSSKCRGSAFVHDLTTDKILFVITKVTRQIALICLEMNHRFALLLYHVLKYFSTE